LVERPDTQPIIATDEVLTYLAKRKNIIEGVCITGGEPTLYPELPQFITKIKALGLKVKLDTNGTNPVMMKELADNRLIDYVAMDIKNSKDKYIQTAGNKDISPDKVNESVSLLLSDIVDYEFRTTVVNELHTKDDMEAIGGWIKGAKAYYLQAYKDSGDVIVPGFTSPSKETLLQYKELLSAYVEHADIRGVD
jgi:pyruvate formate lyase activating enzyme